jgi:hypothetical protein
VDREKFIHPDQIKQHLMAIIQGWATDSYFTHHLKERILRKVEEEDQGIIGAYRLFLTDKDMEGLKARVIHKFLGNNAGSSGGNLT